MGNLCMKLTVCTKQTRIDDFIKIGNPQQCLLKLTERIAVQVINALKVAVYLKLQEQFVKFPPKIMLCACRWSVGNHSNF